MITFQKQITYGGNAAATSVKSVTVVFDLPTYEYAQAADGQSVTRHITTRVQSSSITQAVADTVYRVVPGDDFISGGDAQSALAREFSLKALQPGAETDLVVTAVVRYLLDTSHELGRQTLEFICLPTLELQPSQMVEASRVRLPIGRSSYLAVNRQAFDKLRKQLAGASLNLPDGVVLATIAALTVFDSDTPVMQDSTSAEFKAWLDALAGRTTTADANKILKVIRSAAASLFDFPLTIPEVRTLSIGGSFTIVAPTGVAVTAADFGAYELSAELLYGGQETPRVVKFRFDDKVTVTGASATFSLTGSEPFYRNDLREPVKVAVKGVDGVVWSRDFKPADDTLSKLDIQVPLQLRTTLNPVPADAERDKTKKLRGRVLTFNPDCKLKDALVLIQARETEDASWTIVGAGTTDGSGNFSIPYPYGTFVEAQGVVSLAPGEPASIAIIADEGDVTISDDFLYLLLRNPNCPAPAGDEDCDCKSPDKANRLPDYADLIDSDAYSQDIGGSCVNLSKPNRTISEFNYQAIVRTSDPDVANYTLTKRETGLEAIDVAVAASLSSGSVALSMAQATALTSMQNSYDSSSNIWLFHALAALKAASPHVDAVKAALALGAPPVTLTVLATTQNHVDSVSAILEASKALLAANDWPGFTADQQRVLDTASSLRSVLTVAIDTVGTLAKYELTGGSATRARRPIALDNPVSWQDAPEEPAAAAGASIQPLAFAGGGRFERSSGVPIKIPWQAPPAAGGQSATFSQAVTVATGHILHYKALFKADGYSLGDLIYSLPLAPGQKKEIVVFDASHTLVGAESQALSQNERLAMGLVDERDITSQLAGNLSESLRGRSTANTSGISAGFGTGGQGSGGTGAYGGSGSAVLGVAGGVAQASSNAAQDSSRDVAQFFGEKLRQSIMQNAEGYRQLNASVVTTVQEGQRYGVTSEVVANHNHCHALTMMYFEVLRHYAIFQELSSVEECVFVPFLLTRFSTENVAKWRDVLAPALLPLPSDTYLQPFTAMAGPGRQHPLVKAFDADQRIRMHYANVDFPEGAYDDEPIRFIKGEMTLRVNFPRPRTRYDRILSFPIVTNTTTTTNEAGALAGGGVGGVAGSIIGSAIGEALVPGLGLIIGAIAGGAAGTAEGARIGGDTTTTVSLVKQQIFDLFMQLDANFQTVPPAQCIRVKSFQPTSYTFGAIPGVSPGITIPISGRNFFENDPKEEERWTRYAKILGFSNVLNFLDNYFAGRLISEWDEIFNKDIAPAVFEALLEGIKITEINADFTSASSYEGGERVMRLFVHGTCSKKRNQLPLQLKMSVSNTDVAALKDFTTVIVENLRLSYSTAHYNGILYSANVNNDLLDDADLDIPENPDEKRNPRREDRYLAAKLIEHLNSNLEYYNKVLWFNLDPDRRYMLLDGFSIQVFNEDGTPISAPAGMRSLASVVKNEVVTVAGNSLVFPVAPGYRVSGSFIRPVTTDTANVVTLLDHYQPLTPVEPFRISVPSRGVFAEAVQGACNACEKIETERLQDWNRFPIGDEPTSIAPITAPTPVVTDWRAAFKDFAAPIVNVQNAPAAPAPGAGLQGLSDLLGKSGVFKDITGLDANQQNAIRTYLSNQENAKAFAEMAKEMAMQTHNTQNSGKIMDSMKAAKDSGAINQQEYGQLVKDHLQQQIDGGATKRAQLEKDRQSTPSPLTKAAVDAAGQGKDVKAQRIDSEGNSESVSIGGGASDAVLAEVPGVVPALAQTKDNDCWAVCATMMASWKLGQSLAVEEAIAGAGQKYVEMYRNDTGLPIEEKEPFIAAMGMHAEPPMSVGPQQYVDWMKAYGPLWITADADSRKGRFSLHARVLTKITGDASGDGSRVTMTLIDPDTGTEAPESFTDFIASFEQAVTDNPTGTLAIQVVHFTDRLPAPTEGGRPAPAHKTGVGAVSRLGSPSAPKASSERVETVLSGVQKMLDAVIDGVVEWRDSPDAELVESVETSLVDVAKEALKEEALDQAKKIPGLGMIIVAAEVSKVIADTVGQHLDEVNAQLRQDYKAAEDRDPGSDGYTDEDIVALRNATSYQANAVIGMRVILTNTAVDMAEKAATYLATWLSKTVIKTIAGKLVRSIVIKMVDKGPIGAVITSAVDAARTAIPSETKQRVYRESFAIVLRMFIRQLGEKTTRDRLKGLTELGGTDKPLEKRLVEGLVSMIVDPVFQSLDAKAKSYAYEQIKSLFDDIRAGGIAVESTSGQAVVLETDRVLVPQVVLTRIESGDLVADAIEQAELDQLSSVFGPLARALGAKLTLLSRTRQAKIAAAYATEAGIDAWSDYLDDVRQQCLDFRSRFYQAAGEFAQGSMAGRLYPNAVTLEMIEGPALQFGLFTKAFEFSSGVFRTQGAVRR